ncbi:MAG: V-type ATPase subunit a family protein [Deltaproteobacteria bacterium]|nr:V-type ATPase subunit a family protein [Deltaproteobacteria bacterium]
MLRLLLSALCSGLIGILSSTFWHESIGRALIGTKDIWGYRWNSNSEEVITTILVFALFFFITFAVTYYKIFKRITTFKNTAMGIVASSKDIIHSKNISFSDTDKRDIQYYGQAEEEINNGEVQKDLWSLALVKAKGKEELRKVEYIKLRVKQLQQ